MAVSSFFLWVCSPRTRPFLTGWQDFHFVADAQVSIGKCSGDNRAEPGDAEDPVNGQARAGKIESNIW